MKDSLYIVAGTLFVIWAIGFLAFSVGSVIHLLLVIAFIAVLYRFIQGRKPQ